MAVFGMLNPSVTVSQLQSKFAALLTALENLEDAYQWVSAYSQGDLENPPLGFDPDDAQAILSALADAHDFYQTGQGTPGFPLPALPYNFLASMRVVTGAR